MKPVPFAYEAPGSVDEALALLADADVDTKVLAGGQSLLAMMNLRLAAPERLVDVTRIPELRAVRAARDHVEIGAAVRQSGAEDAAQVRSGIPLLAMALDHVAHREIRNSGTVCGSIAHADAAAEIPTVALTLDAEMVAASSRGTRTIPAAEFFRAYLTTALEPDEILLAVRFPTQRPGSGSAFQEIAARKGDYAFAGVAAHLAADGGVITHAALGYLGVDNRPVRGTAAERVLIGAAPSADLFAEAAEAAMAEMNPLDDLHATARYRRHTAGVLTRRVLAAAAAQAMSGDVPTAEEST